MTPLTRDAPLHQLGYEQITDLSSATTLTVPDGAKFALVQALDQNVRWRDDGTSPTSSVGMQLAAGGDMWYPGGHDGLSVIEFIEESSGAELNVAYYTH